MSAGRVLFVGCGPGAEDLLTVRAVRALQRADIVVWNAALLDRQALADHTREETEIVAWPPATLDDVLAAFERARAEDLVVVRLKGGDPTVFGALEPELTAVRERGIAYDIVPGISALSAGAAALGVEVATREGPLLLADAGALAGPAEPAVVAVYGAGRGPRELEAALLARGLPGSTPCTVAIELARRDEMLVACTLAELGETVEDIGMGGTLTLVLAGVAEASADGSART